MPKKKDEQPKATQTRGMPDFDTMSDEELARQKTILALRKEWLAVEKEAFTRLERERELCNISTALREFTRFLNPFRDFLVNLPNLVQDLVPEMKPDQYEKLTDQVAEQVNRLAQNALNLTLESTRDEKDAATDIAREDKRRSNRLHGRHKDAKK